MARTQTMVQLTDELLKLLDAEANRRGVSRSSLIREAVAALLAERAEAAVTQAIVEGYRRVPPATPDVLTRTEAVAVLNQILAVPATRTVRSIPTEVPLGEADGMPAACVLTLDNVSVIRPALCTERITTLGADKMALVCEALRRATAC